MAMSARGYTHVRNLLPEIKAMIASGKTQREIAEYFGFKSKEVIKRRTRTTQRTQASSWNQATCKGSPTEECRTQRHYLRAGI